MGLARLAAVAMIATAAATAATGVQAQSAGENTVTLKSFDGFTQLRGELVGFDGTVFTIKTVLGVIQVDALQVNCEGEACPADLLFDAKFGIHGSNAIGRDLMPALVEGYADRMDATLVSEVGAQDRERLLRIVHPSGREMAAIDVRTYGSGSAFDGISEGSASIGMSSRRASEGDVAKLRNAGIADPRETAGEILLGLDGLVVVVHPDNPVQSISLEELALIFSGRVTDWSQLGGDSGPINVYGRDVASGTAQTFTSLVLRPYGLQQSPSATLLDSNVVVSDSVAGDVAGVGIVGVADERAAKALPVRQECGLLSHPTTFAIKTEEYPLARRLYLYSPPEGVPAHAKQLMTFATSEEAQPIIAEAGFVDQSVERRSINDQGARLINAITVEDEVSFPLLREMLNELRDAERLSTTFRFTPGSSNLTPKSAADAAQLAREISLGAFQGKEVLLIGFTDSVGQFEINRGLSARRAEVVASVIRGGVAQVLENTLISVRGYGELTPVGCNTSIQGRTANRRVEVWVRNLR